MALRHAATFFLIPFALGSRAFAVQISGQLLDKNDEPVAHASVIVRETLDAARTDDDGRFSLDLPEDGPVTFAITAPNQKSIDQTVTLKPGEALTLHVPVAVATGLSMDAMTVYGGEPSTVAQTKPGSMGPIDVALTPGAGADINRVIQTLPGAQNVDDGNAIYFRGGDYWETAPYIDGASFPTAVRLEAPTGTFVGTVGPFLAKKINFLSNGFSVRYGNLLSGVIELETLDRPTNFSTTLNVGLGALSFGGNLPVGKDFGVRVTATRLDLNPVIKLNRSPYPLDPAPSGTDLSASVVWNYRRGGELKIFGIEQTQKVGVEIEQPSYVGFYRQNRASDVAVLSWKDSFGGVRIRGAFSAARSRTDETFGGLELSTIIPSHRWELEGSYALTNDIEVTAGLEREQTELHTEGRKPGSFDALAPGSDQVDLSARVKGARTGMFAEAEWMARKDLTLTAGVRGDEASLAKRRTSDPRFSADYDLGSKTHLIAAAGEYHQVPDILFFNPGLGGTALASMRVVQRVVGLEMGDVDRQLRVEFYQKDYRDLTQFTRSRTVATGGVGRSRGVDIFAKSPLPRGFVGRATLSLADVERTDPDSGILSRPAFGIRNSTTLILQRAFAGGYQAGVSWRYGSGKPFTDIVGANYDAERGVYAPIYGAPFAARLPISQRLDFNLSKISWHGLHYSSVWYLAISNVLGRTNVYDYVYSADYRERHVQPGALNRVIYAGFTVTYR